MTKDRAEPAIELYQRKKVQKILISGDHGTNNYDEVNTIKDFLLKQGIPGEDIFLDHAGFDTYDSLYRAKEIFQVSSVIVVTQRFHITRAVYIGQSLGVETTGIAADKQDYGHVECVEFREKIARVKAFLDVVFHSKPKFLGEAIPASVQCSRPS